MPSINENTKAAIMGNALRAFHREAWLLEAAELSEATGTPTAEIVEGFFSPFCDRLVEATEGAEDSEKLRFYWFNMFTELAIGKTSDPKIAIIEAY